MKKSLGILMGVLCLFAFSCADPSVEKGETEKEVDLTFSLPAVYKTKNRNTKNISNEYGDYTVSNRIEITLNSDNSYVLKDIDVAVFSKVASAYSSEFIKGKEYENVILGNKGTFTFDKESSTVSFLKTTYFDSSYQDDSVNGDDMSTWKAVESGGNNSFTMDFLTSTSSVCLKKGVLNGLLRHENLDIYVTGSNSKFLSSDILTEFRGRGDEIRVRPFSFSEFFSAYNGERKSAWKDYITYGGLPRILSCKSDEQKSKYLMDLFKNVYIKDIIERNRLKGDVIMENLVEVLASSVGSLTNPVKLANTFVSNGIKANDKTISSYIGYLEDSFLIEKAERYDIKGKKYINSKRKYYFCDNGLRNSLLNFREQELSHLMENILYNELLFRGYNVDVGVVEKYSVDQNGKQSHNQLEIDFVCNFASSRCYIQSAYSIPSAEKLKQETASLDRVNDSFKKIIVTADEINPYQTEKGYYFINIIDFLLDDKMLEKII